MPRTTPMLGEESPGVVGDEVDLAAGNRSTMDSMSSASSMDMDTASAKCLYPSYDHASIFLFGYTCRR